MKRILCLAVALCAAVGAICQAAPDAPARVAEPADREYQDVVYFAESRPLLIRLHLGIDGRPVSALWNDYVAKVFTYLDTNGDGSLDKNEVSRMPAPDVLFGGSYGGAAPTMADLDTNGDGKVTRDELAAWFRRVGATPFQVPEGGSRVGDGRNYLRIQLDDGDAQTFYIDGGAGNRGRGTDAVNEALFKLLDTNGDGKLSKAELAAAPAILAKRDRNDDEMITPDEILPGAGRGGNDYEALFITLVRSQREQGNRRANGPFWMAHPGASRAELARQLLQHYGPNTKTGQKATKLSRKNLNLDEASFAKLDVDGDGALDTEELARFDQRPPDLELKVDVGPKASVELVKRGLALEANVRAGKDGILMLELAGTRLDLKSLALQKVDVDLAAKQEREQYLAEFKKADRDNNGYLDRAEAMRSPLFGRLFKAMDRDGDGMLFEKEVVAYLDAYQGLQAAARASCATVGITSEGKGLFELIDTDGDGRLSVRELRNAIKLIAELDRDGDGMLSRTEIPRCSQATFRTGPATATASTYNQAVVFRSTQVGGRVRQPAKPERGPEWFRKMDRNGDGDVSRREFLGTDEQFRAIDTDGDGLISIEEAEAYEKKVREKK